MMGLAMHSKIGNGLIKALGAVFFRSPFQFTYFLKAMGFEDGECVRALERHKRLTYEEAMATIYRTVALPFHPNASKRNQPLKAISKKISV